MFFEKVLIGIIVVLIGFLVAVLAHITYDTFIREHITSGVVTAKWHQVAYTSIVMVPAGKIFIPATQYHPERWWLTVRGTLRNGTPDEESFTFNKDFWDKTQVGDTITL